MLSIPSLITGPLTVTRTVIWRPWCRVVRRYCYFIIPPLVCLRRNSPRTVSRNADMVTHCIRQYSRWSLGTGGMSLTYNSLKSLHSTRFWTRFKKSAFWNYYKYDFLFLQNILSRAKKTTYWKNESAIVPQKNVLGRISFLFKTIHILVNKTIRRQPCKPMTRTNWYSMETSRLQINGSKRLSITHSTYQNVERFKLIEINKHR